MTRIVRTSYRHKRPRGKRLPVSIEQAVGFAISHMGVKNVLSTDRMGA